MSTDSKNMRDFVSIQQKVPNWNSRLSAISKLTFAFFKKPKFAKKIDMAQHIKMDYAQNLKKDPVKAKKGPSQNFYRVLSAHFALLQYKEFAAI